jgi:flagella basal body P-ring formation protein FlgA
MKRLILVVLGFVLGFLATAALAENLPNPPSNIRLVGRSETVVTEPVIHLADVAQVDSPNLQDDEAIIQLKKVEIAQSPKAGETRVIDGTQILERLRDQGVRLSSIRYTLPRQVTVTRAYREVKVDELQRALTAFLMKSDRQLDVKHIVMDKPVRIPTDSFGLEVVSLQTTQPGHIGVDFKSIAGSDEVRFQLKAIADEWRMMPIATRPLTRGSTVSASDVQLQRINGTSIGRDSIENIGDIVGRSLTKDLGQGEMFKAGVVVVPPVVTAGSQVTIVFKFGRLEATASGVALENGGMNQEIRVRNERSKKIILAKVTDEGLVSAGGE